MKKRLMLVIAGMALITGACTSLFMVGKGEERGVFLGSNSKAAFEMLCTSGELKEVLEATHLNRETKDTLYKYNCSDERSSDKFQQVFASMTPDQKQDIMNAFKEKGFAINGGS